jgi:hypothetical protein
MQFRHSTCCNEEFIMSSRREFMQGSAAIALVPMPFVIGARDDDAFVPLFLRALLGAMSTAVAQSAVAARVATASSTAARIGKHVGQQVTVATRSSQHLLRPSVYIRNRTNAYQTVSTLHITEYNLSDGGNRQLTIAPSTAPPQFDQVQSYSTLDWQYRQGRDYLREVTAIDQCGCATRLESELVICA